MAQAPAGADKDFFKFFDLDAALLSTSTLDRASSDNTNSRSRNFGVGGPTHNPFGVARNIRFAATQDNKHGVVQYGAPPEHIEHNLTVAAQLEAPVEPVIVERVDKFVIHIDSDFRGACLYPVSPSCDFSEYRSIPLPHISLLDKHSLDVKCSEQGNSMYRVGKPKDNVLYVNTVPLVAFHSIVEHMRPSEDGEGQQFVPKFSAWILSPLFQHLKQKLSRARYESNMLRGVYSLVGTLGIDVSLVLVQDTITFWIEELRYLHSRTINAILDVKGVNNLRYIMYESLEPFFGKFIGVQEYHAPIIRSSIDYVSTVSGPEYDFRPFKLVGKYKYLNDFRDVDYQYYKEALWDALGTVKKGEKIKQPTHTTMFFELRGEYGTFLEYTPNPHNRRYGSKRLLANVDPLVVEKGERLARAILANINPEVYDILQRRDNLSPARLASIHLAEGSVLLSDEEREMLDFTQYLLRNFGYSYARQLINALHKSVRDMYNAFLDGAITRLPVHSLRECYLQNVKGPKLKERKNMLANYIVHDEDDVMLKKATAEVKVEYAKPGKVPRLFVSMFIAFLFNFHIMFLVKIVLHGAHYIKTKIAGRSISGNVFILVKPQHSDLRHIFTMLCQTTQYIDQPSVVAAVSGDDAIMSLTDGVITMSCNTDAISCDAHQGSLGMGLMSAGVALFDPAIGIGSAKQAMVPVQIGDVTIEMPNAMLGSGNSATTTVNSFTSALNVKAVSIKLAAHMNREFASIADREASLISVVKDAANMIGHEVTVEIVQNPFMYQFLKRSPFYHEPSNSWYPYLNMGAIFRRLGCLAGDMSCLTIGVKVPVFRKMDHTARMEAYVGGVVAGLIGEPTNPVIHALRLRFPPINGIEIHKNCIREDLFTGEVVTSYAAMDNTEAIMARYSLSIEDLQEFADQIINLQVGQICTSKAMTAFLLIDYGLKET